MRPTKRNAKTAAKAALDALNRVAASKPREPVGFVVRYDTHTFPLIFAPAPFINEGYVLLVDGNESTMFATWDRAFAAIQNTVKYQLRHKLMWSEMYGGYVIEPIFA